jgi:hypothetical protein
VKFQVSRAAPCDGDHSEDETFGRRIREPESRIQKEVRSQEELKRQYSEENGAEVNSLKTFAPLWLSGEFTVPPCLCGEFSVNFVVKFRVRESSGGL